MLSIKDLECDDPAEIIPDGENNVFYKETFYFSNNVYVDSDDLYSRLSEATSNGCFKQYVQESVKGLATIVNIHPSEIVEAVPPKLLDDTEVTVYAGW